MWSSEGYLLGILKQNVLSGVRSPTWNLTVDVDPYIVQEESNVAVVLSEVDVCEEQEISNDISLYDLSFKVSTAHSAIFARSELRKRIDLSSKFLALDFNLRDSKTPTRTSHVAFSDDRSLSSIADTISIASSQSKASKSSAQALLDLRSTDDQLSSTSNLTLDQRRRKQKTLDAVGNHYLKKNGIVLPLVGKEKSMNLEEPKIFEWEREERRMTQLPKTTSLYMLPKTSPASATLQAIDEKCSKRGGKAFDDLDKALKNLN